MQTAVPELTDLTKEPDTTVKMYGADCPCLEHTLPIACWPESCQNLESGLQLYHQGWDQHGNLVGDAVAGRRM